MFGSPLTAKKINISSIVQNYQFKMLLASISVGVIAGIFISIFRLKLGMPGHKAFFWMTPVLIARLRGKCKIGATAGGFFAALFTAIIFVIEAAVFVFLFTFFLSFVDPAIVAWFLFL